jgi:hypothetical protein
MEENMWEVLKTDCSMDLDNILYYREKVKWVNGIMGNAFDGLNPHSRYDIIIYSKEHF